VTRNTSR